MKIKKMKIYNTIQNSRGLRGGGGKIRHSWGGGDSPSVSLPESLLLAHERLKH